MGVGREEKKVELQRSAHAAAGHSESVRRTPARRGSRDRQSWRSQRTLPQP